MDSQTVFNILVLIFGGGGLGALLVFALNFRKQNMDEIVQSRNVLLEDNARLEAKLKEANKTIDELNLSVKSIQADMAEQLLEKANQRSEEIAVVAAENIRQIATIVADHLKKLAEQKTSNDLLIAELRGTISKKDAVIDELTKRIAQHSNVEGGHSESIG